MNRSHAAISRFIKNPLFLIALVSLSLQVLGTTESSLFGFFKSEASLMEWLSLDLKHPFSHGGIPLLLSPFIHISFPHFFVNVMLFIISGFLFLKYRPRFFIARLLLLGLTINFLIVALSLTLGLNEGRVLGLSGIVLSLFTYVILCEPKKYVILFFALVISFWALPEHSTSMTFWGHTMGLFVGITAYLVWPPNLKRPSKVSNSP